MEVGTHPRAVIKIAGVAEVFEQMPQHWDRGCHDGAGRLDEAPEDEWKGVVCGMWVSRCCCYWGGGESNAVSQLKSPSSRTFTVVNLRKMLVSRWEIRAVCDEIDLLDNASDPGKDTHRHGNGDPNLLSVVHIISQKKSPGE